MTSVLISVAVAVLTFAGGMIGLVLQKRLPNAHMSAGSRDMIGAVIGLVSLLLALVLGTLVGSSYGFYATQKSEVETMFARSIELDKDLAEYGTETQPIRAALKQELLHVYKTFWLGADEDPVEYTIESYMPGFKELDFRIASLNPTTPMQKQLVSTIAGSIGLIEQTRLLTSLQLASPVPWPLLVIVVSWAVFLFCGFGLLSYLNSTTVAALTFGAFAVASAIFLILGLNDPYSRVFHIPRAAIERTLASLGN